jgi:hypothetical protein
MLTPVSARSSRRWRKRSAAVRLVLLSLVLAVAVAVLPSIASAAGKRGAAEVIVVQPANPVSFAGPTPECPQGVGQFALAGPSGKSAGTAQTCIQAVTETGPTSLRIETLFTFFLKRGNIVVDMTIEERFFDAEAPGVTFQKFSGSVTSGTRAYRKKTGRVFGAGTLTFNPDQTLTPDSVLVIVLKKRR